MGVRPLFQLDPRLMECASLVEHGAAAYREVPSTIVGRGQIVRWIAEDSTPRGGHGRDRRYGGRDDDPYFGTGPLAKTGGDLDPTAHDFGG